MSYYIHFTTEEREKSRVMLEQEFSLRAPSSVSREIRRNSYANGTYAAFHADKLYHQRRQNCRGSYVLLKPDVREYVLTKLNLR